MTITVLVALLVCLIPTTIGALLSAIGIAGIGSLDRQERDRDVRPRRRGRRRRRRPAARQDRHHHARQPPGVRVPARPGVTPQQLADAAQLASLADETPEGRSIVVLAKTAFGLRERDVQEIGATFIRFSAQTRMSGVDLPDRSIRKGAADAIAAWVAAKNVAVSERSPGAGRHRRAPRLHAARRRRAATRRGARRDRAEGHRQGRHQGALRRAAADGHQDGDDHRRQPAHRGRDRRGGRRRRLPAPRRRPKRS